MLFWFQRPNFVLEVISIRWYVFFAKYRNLLYSSKLPDAYESLSGLYYFEFYDLQKKSAVET